ncbi:MAG: translation elongation factor Ts [Flavobacteriales bacterium]|jgi:elongation factor Ts|tara:strand:- start:13023 stop:13847 length:825 start_codon:yes stop_codon:yes gene_type:complete
MEKITASEVNNLRKMSGAGIMDCKNALVEANGNVEVAIDILRKKGQKVAAKRANRESTEGAAIAKVSADSTSGVIISLNCETDFVAKNESFISLANELAELALNFDTMDEFLNSSIDSMTVSDKLIQQTGVIGEKLIIGSFEKISASYVGKYIHAGNKIATIVGLSSSIEGIEEAAKNVAMQAAAMNPIALDESGVDQKTIDKEIEIAKDQLRQEGKPEAMLENISKGKLKRFFKDNTLVNQDYIKNNKQSVSSYIKSINSELTITAFRRVGLV